MDTHKTEPVSGPPWLDAWTGLEPDPAAMNRVADFMIAEMAAQNPTAAPDADESAFRRILTVWSVVFVAGYLLRTSLAVWYTTHPYWVILGVSGGIASLLVPVISVLLRRAPASGLMHLD